MFNSKKSLLSAISLLALLSMTSQPVLSTSTDGEGESTSSPPTKSLPSKIHEEEHVQGKTASQSLQEFKSGLMVGAALSTVKQAFDGFQKNFEEWVHAPRTLSGLEEMQSFMTNVQSVREMMQFFAKKLSEYDDLGVEKLTEKSSSALQTLLPQDMDFLTGNFSQATTQPTLVQEDQVGKAPAPSANPAVVEEDQETYDKLMNTPQGRIRLNNEALDLLKADKAAGRLPKIEEVAAQKPAKGFFKQLGRALEAQVDWWSVSFSNLEKVINVDPLPPEIEWEKYGAQRGTAKKYNEKLLELLLQKRNGELKQKYTLKN